MDTSSKINWSNQIIFYNTSLFLYEYVIKL